MDPKNFDNILKEKLNGISSASSSMPDWSRMEKELELDSNKDQIFDEQVKRKLDQVKVTSFSKSNWNTLYQLINTRILRKKAVFISKAFELSIFALLFLTAGNLGLFNQENQTNILYAFETSIPTEIIIPAEIYSEEIINEESIISAPLIEPILESNTLIQVSNEDKRSIKSNAKISNDNFQIARAIHDHKNLLETKDLLEATKIDSESFKNSSIASYSSKSDFTVAALIDVAPAVEESEIDHLKLDFSSINSSISTELLAQAPVIALLEKKKQKWFITGGLQTNNNFIKSGFRESIARTRAGGSNIDVEKEISALSYGVNSTIGYRTKSADFSTGIEYNQVSYNPSIVLKTGSLSTDILETNIREITYDIVSVPLNMDWNIFKVKTWKAQINTGIVTSILTKTQQSINQNLVTSRGVEMVAEEKIDLSPLKYNFSGGIFDAPSNSETKNLSRSVFVRAKVGVGISKQVTPSVSIFGNLNYLYHIPTNSSNSVLDLNDRINSVSFGIGVKKFIG